MDLSVVICVYNESGNIGPLLEETVQAVSRLGRSYEIVVVDDGSSDGTRDELRKLRDRFAELRVVLFRRNFGQTAALAAGFDHARGRVVVTMDADLQNDPADIPRLLAK
ncbi:MAG: glycosyltransferase, partial [Candidatus Binatia bacterium]